MYFRAEGSGAQLFGEAARLFLAAACLRIAGHVATALVPAVSDEVTHIVPFELGGVRHPFALDQRLELGRPGVQPGPAEGGEETMTNRGAIRMPVVPGAYPAWCQVVLDAAPEAVELPLEEIVAGAG